MPIILREKPFFVLFYAQLRPTLSSVTNNPMIGSDKPFKSTREGRNPLRTLRVERQIVFQLFLREKLGISALTCGFKRFIRPTREGRNPLRTLRVERQIVFQLFLREWDSKLP